MSYAPGVVLCRLYERTTKKSGKRYFAGRLGAASVAMFDTGEVTETGQPVWVVKVSPPLEQTDATQLRKPDAAEKAAAERGFAREPEDSIPF